MLFLQQRQITQFVVIVALYCSCCYDSIVGAVSSSGVTSLSSSHHDTYKGRSYSKRSLQSSTTTTTTNNSSTTCVYDAIGLQSAIASVPVGTNIPLTMIKICHPILYTANITSWTTHLPTFDSYAFDISDRNIALSCNVTSSMPTNITDPLCVIDGINTNNGLFVGSRTNMTVSGISFRNGGSPKTYEHTNGGAFHIYNQSTLIVNGTSLFEQNTAFYGGAVAIDKSSTLILKDDRSTLFGSIVTESDVVTNSTIRFQYNYAWSGGAIHGTASSTIVSSSKNPVLFRNNTALRYAGAIYISCNSYATFNNDGFYNNRCHTDGGVFAINQQTNLSLTGSFVDSNTAGHQVSTKQTNKQKQ